MGDAREDDPSAVAIIFDGNPNYWEDDATLAGAIDAVLLFANTFRLLNAGNRLLLVGVPVGVEVRTYAECRSALFLYAGPRAHAASSTR